MADRIVGFSIDIKGQQDIKTTTQLLGLLNTQLILVGNTLNVLEKTSGKAFDELSKDVKNVSGSVAQMGGVVKTSFRTFEEGNKVVQDLGNGYLEASRRIEETAKTVKGLSKEELILKEIEKERLKELKQIAKQEAIIQANGKDSIAGLRAQLSLATLQWKKYTQEQIKNTVEGRKAAAEVLRLSNALEKEEKAVGNATRGVGKYENAVKGLSKTLLKLSVGRDVIRGLFEAFTNIIKSGADTNPVFANILKSFERLKTFATGLATTFLNTFGGAVTKTVESFSFAISKVVEFATSLTTGFNNLANSGGVLGTTFTFIKDLFGTIITIFTEFPSVIGGVIEVFTEFKNIATRTFSEVALNLEKVFVNIKRVGTALTGGDTAEIDKRLGEINKKLSENTIFARGIGQAFEDGFNRTKKAQDEFNKSIDTETKNLEAREAAAKAREDARLKAIEEEKKRIEELTQARTQALEDLKANQLARLEIIKDLSNELIEAEIEGIEDATQKALAAEKERFRLESEARKENINQIAADIKAETEKLKTLFGAQSQEVKDFTRESGQELNLIKDIVRKQDEQAEKNHQNTLTQIIEDGTQKQLEAEQKAAKRSIEIRREELAESEQLFQEFIENNEAEAEAQIALDVENAKARTEATKNEFVNLVNTAFSAISDIVQIANEAENARFDAAIERRQEGISKLQEDLQNATGLQKKFLERQLKQEEEALKKETEAKEKARKEQAEAQKAISIIQAVIAAALAITNAFTLPPPASFIAAAATAVATAAQIAVIASQQFAKGGILQGRSHAEGGIPAIVGGTTPVELEGGEAVINKKSTAMFRRQLSEINAAGGGVRFATGGVVSSPMFAPSVANSQSDVNQQFNQFLEASLAMSAATNRRIDRLQVVQDLNNLQDIQKNDSKLQVQTTLK